MDAESIEGLATPSLFGAAGAILRGIRANEHSFSEPGTAIDVRMFLTANPLKC